ncbi:uncharacterized protein LOC134252600 [Saccostrea cucullata]|uniref:uncharacterized protein LOC134252600 n=1 Tax=Saccostrea cuccullata TaxID=36930 RepID=UPI002ED2C25A
MQKTKFEMTSNQEIFHGIDQMFKKELSDDQAQGIRENAAHVPPEHLDIFLEILFECIMLNITKPEENEEDNRLHTSLHDTMFGYIDARAYDVEEEFPDWAVSVLGRIIQNEGDLKIENCQAIKTWETLYETSCLRRDNV